jgi:hypothetical protein
VIGKITAPRGERVEGLIYYLFGPGRREEHTDPHIVVGWRHPAELEPPLRLDGRRDFRHLLGLLNQPHAAMGAWALARPVWHCSMRTAPEDKMLSDDEWAQIACDVMNRTGLSPFGQEDDAVRWVAIRHGDDHIHIVAMLARQDGRRPRLSNDRYRVREACLAAEERYGLRRTAPGDRTAARRPGRAETEKAGRSGRAETPRVTLRRRVCEAAARAGWAPAFDARWLGQADLLQAAGVWGAAAAYADADPEAAAAVCKCEERLRVLHPYAMAWYDRLRGEGVGAVEAMRQTVPLFGWAPHTRPGDPAAERRVLEAPAGLDSADGAAAGQDGPDAWAGSVHVRPSHTVVQLAAESFPCTAVDAVMAAASFGVRAGRSNPQTVPVQSIQRPGRSL